LHEVQPQNGLDLFYNPGAHTGQYILNIDNINSYSILLISKGKLSML